MSSLNPICLFREWWRTVRIGARVDGCTYVVDEVHEGCHVAILRCSGCGKTEISWDYGAPPEGLRGVGPGRQSDVARIQLVESVDGKVQGP